MFISSGLVITCDPKDIVLDNQLGNNHVGFSILYCQSNVSAIMTIWKWPLSYTILDGYTLRKLFISNDETHIPIVDDEGEIGEIGVKKKQDTF